MYAIIEIGGKQFNVEKGTRLRTEKINQEANSELTIDKVLAVKNGDTMQVGQPYVNGATVKAKVVGHGRGKKVVVFKYKSKKNYRRTHGHRQHYTSILIEDINV